MQPKYRGKYCVGERKRFRLCNLQACPTSRPSFRQVQCSHFDAMLYKGQLHTWVPVVNDVNPCELHCRPSNEYFAEKLRDAVVDGTPCYQGQASRDLCINGICKNVGCDFEIDSGAVEDRCGVCHGNGSTCHTVSGTFEEAEGLGYVDVGLIPAGAREIHIEEVAEAANFLALRSEDPDKYFLNGGWTIQWNGDYQVAGTTFTYARTGNWENLTSPGPTDEPVWIQVTASQGPEVAGLLFQESNPGVRYEYTIHREADGHGQIQPPEFSWHYGPWTKCTVTCGTGMQRQSVHCTERQAGPVDERHCDPLGRPDDRQRKCSEEPCPARWWAGEWQPCSSSCGPGGLSRRAVLCIRSVGLDEQSALELPACEHLPRPSAETPCNRDVPCPATWAVGNWSRCSVTCGPGTQHRSILCTNDTGVPCDEAQRPTSEATCLLPPCPWALDTLGPEGSGSGSSSHELFNEIDFIPRRLAPRPPPASSPKPAGMGNAIGEEDPELGLPGPVFVDDFYYDYNFINFHEDLSYGPFEEPNTDLAGTGDWMPPPPSSPAEPSMGIPMPATEPPGTKEEGALGDCPDPIELWTSRTVAWEPALEGSLVPVDVAPPALSGACEDLNCCSTTCGLGAVWRPVRCSSGREEDCAPAGRPQPARRCHLRPCAAWHTGNWSKCSRSCGGGSSVRDVQCVDTRDLRPLRPFHCQPGPPKPPARRPCGAQPCLSWYISSWRECSEACGGGEQQRLVTCPEPGLCEEALRPNSTRPCNTHPCTQWVVGPWGQCSAPCGGGVQRRLVKCVNTQTGLPEEDSDQCDHEAWPESSRPCGAQDCELTEPPRCERDRLSFGFCETLRLLGRCQLPTVRTQCCRSCPPPGHGAPSRGHQRVARR
ncbi:A disintegrin and metalloproteinase with thrombospondin motifs 7 [Camelus dromedarius]|uniref:A disintegrin and metalloproteinase with thrombospondin motifs 7 n=1 Tax=Camelus dromedarius TaxID=9838 RepID=A0A5N4CEA8_CAMDR|nr:A disintegrin and metalloproteinase with thrombospondin motifs 7 [Camelus dromedarius]